MVVLVRAEAVVVTAAAVAVAIVEEVAPEVGVVPTMVELIKVIQPVLRLETVK